MTIKTADKPGEKAAHKRHITAASVALMRLLDDSVLVVRRSPHEQRAPGYYELPGGKVEGAIPETMAESRNTLEVQIAREVAEEVNIALDPKQIWYSENEIIEEPERVIAAMRYLSVFPSGQRVDIRNIRHEDEHNGYEFVKAKVKDHETVPYTRAKNYEAFQYVSGVREFLQKLFVRQQQKGTLLFNVDSIHEYYVNYIFVDPREKKVLLAKDSRNADYNFSLPTTTVLQWEHIHDAIRRGVPECFKGRKLSSDFLGRRVLAKLTPVRRGEITKIEQRCDFIYLIYVPDLFESTQTTSGSEHNYQWVGFRDRALTKECAQLQAKGLHENDILRIFKEILNLNDRKNVIRYRERMFPIVGTTDDQKDALLTSKKVRAKD